MKAVAKIGLQPGKWPPEVGVVMAALAADGVVVRLVGGCVRDAVLERRSVDFDFATPEDPERVSVRLAAAGITALPTGLAHGTVTAVIGAWQAQITTLRRDVETDGRHATVAFTDDWEADARRRDLTINALYCDADGTLYDPVGGLADLKAGRVRFVGDPDRRIAEDALRALRFFRFHAWYGQGAPDAAGLGACARAAGGLAGLSGERVAAELLRLLAAPRPSEVLAVMAASGVLAAVLPEASDFERLAALVALEVDGIAGDGERRLAAVIEPGVNGAHALARRLRLSNKQRDRLALLAEPPVAMAADMDSHRALYHLGRDRFLDLALLWRAGSGGPAAAYRALLDAAQNWTPPRFPLRGADALALGVPEGPEVGRLVAAVEAWWEEGDFRAGRAACLERLETLVASEGPSPIAGATDAE